MREAMVFGTSALVGFCAAWTWQNLEAVENGVYAMRFGLFGWYDRELERYRLMKRVVERRVEWKEERPQRDPH